MHLQAASSRLRYLLRTLSEALRCASQLAWQASGNGYMICRMPEKKLSTLSVKELTSE